MRLWTLALVIVVAVSYCKAKTVEELKALADGAQAPFTPVALERMDNSELWGAKRAGRSVDVVIINKSGKTFGAAPSVRPCSLGSPSPGLLAESTLHGQTSTVLGFQSADDDSYAYIHCGMLYAAEGRGMESFAISFQPENVRGDVFHISTASRSADGHSSIKIRRVHASFDTENNNHQFVFQVDLKNKGDGSPFIQRLGAPVRQRKPKGSRNMLVKASKRGTSVHAI